MYGCWCEQQHNCNSSSCLMSNEIWATTLNIIIKVTTAPTTTHLISWHIVTAVTSSITIFENIIRLMNIKTEISQFARIGRLQEGKKPAVGWSSLNLSTNLISTPTTAAVAHCWGVPNLIPILPLFCLSAAMLESVKANINAVNFAMVVSTLGYHRWMEVLVDNVGMVGVECLHDTRVCEMLALPVSQHNWHTPAPN